MIPRLPLISSAKEKTILSEKELLPSKFSDQATQSDPLSNTSVSDFQSGEVNLLTNAGSKLPTNKSSRSPQNQMPLTAGKALDDEHMTKSALDKLIYKPATGDMESESHLPFKTTTFYDSLDHLLLQPDILESYKQPYFAGSKNRAVMEQRKRVKSGCLTCRRRRIKCGEERPSCDNCAKSKRNCEGYTPSIILKDPLLLFRAPYPKAFSHISSDNKSTDPTVLTADNSNLSSIVAPKENLHLQGLDSRRNISPPRDAQASFPANMSKTNENSTLADYLIDESVTPKSASAKSSSCDQPSRSKEDPESRQTLGFVQDVEDMAKSSEYSTKRQNVLYNPKEPKAVPESNDITVPEKEVNSKTICMNEIPHDPDRASSCPAPNTIAAQSLARQNVSRSQNQEPSNTSITTQSRCNDNSSGTLYSSDRTLRSLGMQYLSIFIGLLWPEPPVAPDKTRIRWTCSCGTHLYDDFIETRPGAAEELRNALHAPEYCRPNGSQSTSSSSSNPSQMSVTGSASTSVGQPNNSRISIYEPNPVNGRPTSATITCDPESKWLLVCAQSWQRPTSLLHLNVCSTSSDQQLFTDLRQLYLQLKRVWWHRLSLQTVKSIRFIQFELYPKDLVDIRKVPDMPPQAKEEEYLYQRCDLLPPIGENLMSHLFHHPHDADEKAIMFLRSPKKRKQKLAVCPQIGTNVGWGIHLVEGWAVTKIWVLIFTTFLLSTLVFAIAWSVLWHDVQGAFSVAAYFVALIGLGVGTLQAYLNER